MIYAWDLETFKMYEIEIPKSKVIHEKIIKLVYKYLIVEQKSCSQSISNISGIHKS